jgi:antitoxin VapB
MIALSEDIEQLARLLAQKAGSTPTEIIRQALQGRAREAGMNISESQYRKPSFERMMAISDRCSERPVLDDRPPDEIVGYDEFGVAR